MDEGEDPEETALGADAELQQVLGPFDVPAFARRGQELEQTLARLHLHCERDRSAKLDMVHLRLRQWAAASDGPESWSNIFSAPIAPLWPLSNAEPPSWGSRSAPYRRRLAIARDLIASVTRFNRRWSDFLNGLNLERANYLIDQYNRYYLLEKECILSSARVAARNFSPKLRVSPDLLLGRYPLLPVPAIVE